jgi:hypothetical protein
MSLPATKRASAKPVTLKSYLADSGKELSALQNNPNELRTAARALLKGKGVSQPTASQLTETQFELNESINQGTWQTFAPRYTPQTVKKEDGVEDRIGNIFYEKTIFSDADLQPAKLVLSDTENQKLRGDFESGRSGMILGASFINLRGRSEGDFSRAYGDVAWRGFMRAHTFLDSIPKGQLLDKLDADLVCEVNKTIHAPDEGMKATLLRGIAAIGRGGRFDYGGELRTGRQYARPEWYTADEVTALKEAGVQVKTTKSKSDGSQYAMLEYPEPSKVKSRLNEIISTLKSDLAKPDADPIAAAAQFQRHLVALHPFGDSNGRTSRVLMNRILAEEGFPPAIFRNQNRDISLTPTQWRRKVAEGVARSKKFLNSARLNSRADYLGGSRVGIRAIEKSPDAPITLDGMPFDLGTDGFLYDPTGRPFIEAGGELVPMSQMGHFILCRRIMQQGKEEGTKTLKSLTESTRSLYDETIANPQKGEGFMVRADSDVRKGDVSYQLTPEPEFAKLLVDLAKVDQIDAAQLFTVKGAKGTDLSSTISKYSQVDLEFWYLEKGLAKSGMKDLASQVKTERGKLFDKAKAHLQEVGDKRFVSDENPLGFQFKYEEMMYNHSALRFSSLDEAVQVMGDDKISVWRGDYSFARMLGMAPNNDIRSKDAKRVARDRAEKGQVTNLYDDLLKLEGSANGKQYICTTSDLSLLTKSFADSKKSRKVDLDASLPGVVADAILAWIDPGAPAEGSENASETRTREVKDTLGVPGTLLSIRLKDKSRQLDVTANRKAFRLELDRDALLPGLVALGGHHFEAEQEIHGLEKVYPWNIKGAYEASELKETFPMTNPEPTVATDVADGEAEGDAVEIEDEDDE